MRKRLPRHHRRHHIRYKNILLSVVGVMLAIALSQTEWFHANVLQLGELGIIGAFIAGMLLVSTFTAASGIVILLFLTKVLPTWQIGIGAGMGAVLSDALIFVYVKDHLTREVKDLYEFFDSERHLEKLFHSHYFSWTLPLIGAIMIATPLPDEIGVSLLGLSKMSTAKFVLISFILHSIGIFFIVSASKFFPL